MKKLFLLLAASSIGLSSIAQQNVNVLSKNGSLDAIMSQHRVENPFNFANGHVRGASTQKTTAPVTVNHSEWFDYTDCNYVSGTSDFYYNVVASDSNILDNSSSTPYHVFIMGVGMSFDPTDNKYYQAANTNPIAGYQMTNATPYVIDSFEVPFRYIRRNNSDTLADSVIVEITLTTNSAVDSGTYALNTSKSATWLSISTDSVARYATARYTRAASALGPNEVWDNIKAPKVRVATPVVLGDTSGTRLIRFGLSTPLSARGGQKAISYVHFKSMHPTTLGTSTVANSNYIHLFTGTTEGDPSFPPQNPRSGTYPGSYQTSLIGTTDLRYSDTGFTFNGNNVLYPGFGFVSPGLSVPQMAFHIKYTLIEDAVANINKTIGKVSAFPNPASNNVTVNFNLSSSSDVTVTLTNTVGQVVATEKLSNVAAGNAIFNTTGLPTGAYFYSVVANGERATGNVTVAH